LAQFHRASGAFVFKTHNNPYIPGLQVTHILQLMSSQSPESASGNLTSQLAVAQFALLPLAEELEDEEDDGRISYHGDGSMEELSEMTL
jgi:hypothetical protein